MPINIPSTTPTTLGTVEILNDEATTHYQQFVITSPSGVSLGSEEYPIPVSMNLTGSFTQAFNANDTLFPSACTFYSETLNNSNAELVDNEISVLRVTAKGGLKTAGDGRVNELISTIADGYDDIFVCLDSFSPESLEVIDPYGTFFDTSYMNGRFIYVPMIRSGWRKLSFSIKSASAGVVTVFADLGSLTADMSVLSKSLSPNVRYGFIPESVPATGIITSIPLLASAVNGIIISFSPSETAAGTFEVHLVRGT